MRRVIEERELSMEELLVRLNESFRPGQDKVARDLQIDALAVEVSRLRWTSSELTKALDVSSRFCERPELALHYYHSCSCDHDTFVYNDETLEEPSVLRRVEEGVEPPVGQAEACGLRNSLGTETMPKALAACASCNEYLVPEWGDTYETRTLSCTLSKETLYTRAELEALFLLPEEVRKHRMFVVDVNGYYHHLNPELVHGDDVILCTQCAANPRGSVQRKFSIANGYDPGLRKHLNARPRRTTRRAIAALRVFKSAKLNVMDKERKGHVILFPSNAPPKVAERLPWTEEVTPTVTFYGAPFRWAGISRQLDAHMSIDAEEVYDYLRVLKLLHKDYQLLPITAEVEGKAALRSIVTDVMHPSDATLFAGGHLSNEVKDDPIHVLESAMIEPVGSVDTVTEMIDVVLRQNEVKAEVNEGACGVRFD